MTKEQINLAGRMIKVLQLAGQPGMDEVAIKLNCGLTYDEQKRAEMWAKAFEIAQKGGKLFDLAAELLHETA
jgi:hypothetical protein